MKRVFNGEAHYPDFDDGYKLYYSRRRWKPAMEESKYRQVIKLFCKILSERLEEDGMVDLPSELGSIAVATLKRNARYKDGKFEGFGKIDWKTGKYDGSKEAFAVVYLPRREKTHNLRCYGFVANKALYGRLKNRYLNGDCNWEPIPFTKEMI